MKKQNNSYRMKKGVSAAGLRGIAQSFVSVGIPPVIESSVREEYSYLKKQGEKSVFHSFMGEVRVKL